MLSLFSWYLRDMLRAGITREMSNVGIAQMWCREIKCDKIVLAARKRIKNSENFRKQNKIHLYNVEYKVLYYLFM